MPRMTSYQMSYILDIDIQRKNSPLLGWVEEKLLTGKGSDQGRYFSEVVDFITVNGPSCIPYSYYWQDYQLHGCYATRARESFCDQRKPSVKELDMLAMLYPEVYKDLKVSCAGIQYDMTKPHSCKIEYSLKTSVCLCGERGEVNYRHSSSNWSYFCGRSDRCLFHR